MNTLTNSRYTSLSLKVVGLILIVSSFLDFITLSIPLKLSQPSWQLQFVTTVVDRGIVPLMGMILFFLGWWLNNTLQEDSNKKKKNFDTRFPLFVIAVIMGMCYLVVIPIHLGNINDLRRSALVRINQQALQSETRIQAEYDQIQELLSDPQGSTKVQEALGQINAILNSEQQLSNEQRLQLEQNRQRLVNFQKYLDKPEVVDQELTRMQGQLDKAKLEKITEANLESVKQGLRIGFNSFLLSLAYSILGWFGLKNAITAKTKSRASVQ